MEIRGKSSLSDKSYLEISVLVPQYLTDLRAYASSYLQSKDLDNIVWSYSNFVSQLLDLLSDAESAAKSIEVDDDEDSDPEDLIYAEAEVLAIKRILAGLIERSYKDIRLQHQQLSGRRGNNVSIHTSNPGQYYSPYSSYAQPLSIKRSLPAWINP